MTFFCRFMVAAPVAVVAALSLGAPHVAAQAAGQPSTAEKTAANAETGKHLYTKYGCYECHGREGQGSSLTGPRLGPNPMSLASLVRYVRKPTREMPPYTDRVVSDQDLADIHAYLRSLRSPAAAQSIPLLK
jgi:ubiquinol-cytochrome c reductase cytochrome c subunit